MMFDDERYLPYFGCTTCHVMEVLDLLCFPTRRGGQLLCVRCCGCETHQQDDIDGTVIWPRRGEEASSPDRRSA